MFDSYMYELIFIITMLFGKKFDVQKSIQNFERKKKEINVDT